jgi:transcriptional regulator GlxA family with amidase domain
MTLTAKEAELCGFENPTSFSRSFHRHVGLSSTAYRESDSPPPVDELSLGK